MTIEAIASRATNASGVSVGTSLAMETIIPNWPIFDKERIAPDFVSLETYKRVWINVRTLFRNLYNSVESGYREGLKADDVAEAMVQEMEEIHRSITSAYAGGVSVMFYNVDYDRVARIFPRAKVRVNSEDMTDKAKAQDKIMRASVKRAREIIETNHKGWWFETGPRIDPGSYGKTILLTHIGLDLLNLYRFGSLTLLESHTGQTKNRNQWYTKFLNGKSLSTIPFCEAMLQVFGDDHIFHPKNITVKRALQQIAQDNHWSFMTTTNKMQGDIAKHPDKLFTREMREFFVTL